MDRDPLVHALSVNIRKYLEDTKLSAKDLALRAEVNQSAVYDILNGRSRSPGVAMVGKLAKAMDMTLVELVAGEDTVAFRDRLAERIERLPNEQRRSMEAMIEAMLATAEKQAPSHLNG